MFRRTLAGIFVIFAAAAFVSASLIVYPMIEVGIYNSALFLRAGFYLLGGLALMVFAGREVDLYRKSKKQERDKNAEMEL